MKMFYFYRYGLELHIVSHEKRFGTFAEAVQNKNGVAVLGILFHVIYLTYTTAVHYANWYHCLSDVVGVRRA